MGKGFCERKFSSMFLSGTFTKAVMYIMLLCDSIIAGYYIGASGVAAINAITPVTGIVTFFGDLVSTGVGIVFTREIGARRKKRADEIYGQGLIISIAIGLISAVTIFLIQDLYFGINGIEGSLSTAAGFSLATDKTVYCVIGDLSFFYDRNALWNESLRGNLRILLLNNGGGAIFEKFAPSLVSDGDVRNVRARHHTLARGMCADNGVEYHSATDAASLEEGLRRLTAPVASRPILLEVFTDAETDWACYRRYLASVSSAKH